MWLTVKRILEESTIEYPLSREILYRCTCTFRRYRHVHSRDICDISLTCLCFPHAVLRLFSLRQKLQNNK